LALMSTVLIAPAAFALTMLGLLAIIDMIRIRPPNTQQMGRFRFRVSVAQLYLLQPIARSWGKVRHREPARRQLAALPVLPGPIDRLRGGVLLMPEHGPRAEIVADVVVLLRRAGLRVLPATGWEDHDGRVLGSHLLAADLVTSSHPIGCVQLRFRRRLRCVPLVGALSAIGAAFWLGWASVGVVATLCLADLGRGLWRTGPFGHRVLVSGSHPRTYRSLHPNLARLAWRRPK
jgi:hypothetical protein